jgi:hypothetical protein
MEQEESEEYRGYRIARIEISPLDGPLAVPGPPGLTRYVIRRQRKGRWEDINFASSLAEARAKVDERITRSEHRARHRKKPG